MKSYKNSLIVVGGSTASGKTSFALKLAEKYNGEIINADSMQVYKHMDIGTNKGKITELGSPELRFENYILKPFLIEKSKVFGWLFNIVEPDYNFTVSEYQKLAYRVIAFIHQRGKVPVLVGGTGLYIDAVIKGYDIQAEPDWQKRRNLEKLNVQELQNKLTKTGFNLEELNESDRKNPRRLIRAIEKQTIQVIPVKGKKSPKYDIEFFYPKFEMEDLERKIRLRAKIILEMNFVEEVKDILETGVPENSKSLQGSGYKQVIQYLNGEILSLEDLEKSIAAAHIQYAKRQRTWFEGKGRGYNLKICSFG